MNYKNAKDVLPEYLIIEIMKYTDGGLVYFPARESKKSWGSLTGLRNELKERDTRIIRDHKNGSSIYELGEKYYLSQSSLYRIINKR
ncbi:MAG TPA: CD3324 family protein [Clostridia bacterium]|nr:CD3324 family protein [Clostridia bacterium]